MAHSSSDLPSETQKEAIREQLTGRGRNITDPRVVQAMTEVPRHAFVPEMFQDQAYSDGPIPIGYGQTISQPYVVALMTQSLQLKPTDRVLEIGVGCGYQTAVLSRLAREVFGMEIVDALAREAQATLRRIGVTNATIRTGDGYGGWPEEGPYDAILVACAPDHVPEQLIEQLKPGGRMVLPVGNLMTGQELWLHERTPTNVSSRPILPVRFVPMTRGTRREF
jgi:protein-L-isoaspartate(D-aspartate) O-methyltransferase